MKRLLLCLAMLVVLLTPVSSTGQGYPQGYNPNVRIVPIEQVAAFKEANAPDEWVAVEELKTFWLYVPQSAETVMERIPEMTPECITKIYMYMVRKSSMPTPPTNITISPSY